MAVEIVSEPPKHPSAKVKKLNANHVIAEVKGHGEMKIVCPSNAARPKEGAEINVRVNLSPSGKPNRAFYIP